MKRSLRLAPAAFAILLGATIASAAGGKSPQPRTLPSPGKPDRVPGELIVKYRSPRAAIGAPSLPSAASVEVLGAKAGRGDFHLIRVKDDPASADAAAASLRRNPNVEYVQPNYIYRANLVPNDPSFGLQWAHANTGQTVNGLAGTSDADMDTAEAWDVSTGTSQVIVALLDSGVDIDHPDLAGNLWTNPGDLPGDGVDNDGNGFVDDVSGWDFFDNDNDPRDHLDHGTHVAGIIGAVGDNGAGIAGAAWNVRLMPLKIMGAAGFTTTARNIAAIAYARAKGVRVINASWNSYLFDQALKDAIDAAGGDGILLVAAAGNDSFNTDSTPSYPASYTSGNVISVAATTQGDALASFSNRGAVSVDLGAPGANIYSTVPTLTQDARVQLYAKTFDGDSPGGVPSGWIVTGTATHSSPWTVQGGANVVSSPHSLQDSPGGDHGNNADSRLWLFTSSFVSKDCAYEIDYRLRFNLESNFDFLDFITASNIFASNPDILTSYTGMTSGFIPETLSGPGLTDIFEAGDRIGFRLFSDGSITSDGVYIDDFRIFRRTLSVTGHGYAFKNGTSMAAPQVSGVAALLLGILPNASVSQLKALILDNVDAVPALSGLVATGGRLNAQKALQAAQVFVLTAPTLFTPVNVSSTSMTWMWPDLSNETGYRIKDAVTGANLSGDMPAGSTQWVQAGLTPNSPQNVVLEAFNDYDRKTSAAQQWHTYANPPANLQLTQVWASSAAVSWESNGNPLGTIYSAAWSSPNPFPPNLFFNGTGLQATVTGLTPDATFYIRVTSFNGDGTSYFGTVVTSSRTLRTPPSAPGAPVVLSRSTDTILWGWDDNASNEDGYRAIDPSSGDNLSGDLPAGATMWLQTGLAGNAQASLLVDAFNNGGTGRSPGSGNVYTLAQAPAGTQFSVFVSSASVQWSANGNSAGTLFEVESSTDGAQFAPAASVSSPSAVLTGLASGTTYYARVRAVAGDGTPSAFDQVASGVTPVRTMNLALNGASVIEASLLQRPVEVEVSPSIAASAATVTLDSPLSFPGPSCPTARLIPTGVGLDVSFSPAPSSTEGGRISLSYTGQDVAGLDQDRLVLARYEPSRGAWIVLPSSIDRGAGRVSAPTPHFSLFQIMALVPSSSVSEAMVYPNPFRPSIGDADVNFSRLPADAKITIFDLAGRKIKELSGDALGASQWRGARREDGGSADSGVYMVLVEGQGGSHVLKLVIQR